MTHDEITQIARTHILENCHPHCAKEFEILGRALYGCGGIAILEDGSAFNGFSYCHSRNWTNADYLASRLIDDAVFHINQMKPALIF